MSEMLGASAGRLLAVTPPERAKLAEAAPSGAAKLEES